MCCSGSASCDEDKASSFSVLQPVVAARKRKLSVEAAKHHLRSFTATLCFVHGETSGFNVVELKVSN